MSKIVKNKVYKVALGSLLVGSLVAPAAIAAGCSTTDLGPIGQSWAFSNHQTVQTTYETSSGQNVYVNDVGAWKTPLVFLPSGSGDARTYQYASSISAFRTVKPQQAELSYDPVTKQVLSQNDQNSFADLKLRFEMVSAVILIDESGTEYVFDRDVSENDPANATDPRDVNSQHFTNVLSSETVGQRIVSIKLRGRNDLSTKHWIRNGDAKAGSVLSMKDLYFGFVNSILAVSRSRLDYSGMGYDLDLTPEKQTKKFQKVVDKVFAASQMQEKPYDLEVPTGTDGQATLISSGYDSSLGLQYEAFTSLDKMNLTLVDSESTIQLRFNASADIINKQDFWSAIGVQRYFSAKPYVETMAIKNQYDANLRKLLVPEVLTDAEWTTFTQSLTYKAGYYHEYLGKFNDFYSAGTYYLESANDKSFTYTRNDNYIDERWLNQVNSQGQQTTVKKFIGQFVNESNQLAVSEAYRQGTGVNGKYSLLSSSEKIDADKGNSYNYGVYRRGGFTSSEVVSDRATKLTLMPVVNSSWTKHYFNDNFSKLLYGLTSKQINENDPKFQSGEYLNYTISGDGYVFRRILLAAMNSYSAARDFTFNNQIDKGTQVDWNTPFAPEGSIYGNDSSTFSRSNPYKLSDQFTKQSLDVNDLGKRILSNFIPKVGADGKITLNEISHDSYKSAYTLPGYSKYGPSTSAVLNGKSPFEIVQMATKELLDKYIGTVPAGTKPEDVPVDKQIIFEFPYDNTGVGNDISGQQILKGYQNVFSSIDPRLRLVAAVTPSSNDNNKYSEAKALLQTWPNEDNYDKFKFAHSSADKTKEFPNYYADDRTNRWGDAKGMTFSAARAWSMNATQDNPISPILNETGYLQSGRIQILSYYSDPANEAKYLSDSTLAPIKRLLDAVKEEFNLYIQNANTSTIKFSSSKKDAYLQALRSLSFESFWKSSPKDMEIYDYYGLKGFESVLADKKLVEAKAENSRSEDETALLKDAESFANYFGAWVNGVNISRVWNNIVRKYTTRQILEMMIAWQAIMPENFNTIRLQITDRSIFRPSISKTWYYSPGDRVNLGSVNYSMYRVDLDFKNNYYLDQPLFKDKNGNFKTAKEGGIVY